MEPITAITTAIATGAAAALNDATQQIIHDLYAGVKTLIQNKYHQASTSLEALEKKPESESKRASLQEDLEESGAANDVELVQQAQALLTAIAEHAPQVAQAIGIKFEDIEAANVRLRDIHVSGQQAAGVSIKGAKVSDDIEISGVTVTASNEKK